MRRLFLILTALIAAAFLFFTLEPPRSEEAALARVERLARNTTEAGHWPALSVAYVAPGEVIWAESFGQADIATARAMTPETPMPIGSISKVIIGLAAALEAEDGFDLDAPLADYWPSVPETVGSVTFRQLATHTGGIADTERGYEGAAYAQNTLRHPTALADYLESYLTQEGTLFEPTAITAPGTAQVYSNVGAALAAQALAEATGTDFASLSQNRVLAPLGLTQATWDATTLPPGTRATLYEHRDGAFEPLAPYALATWPDGGLNASLTDLATLLAVMMSGGMLDGDRLLSQDAIARQRDISANGLRNMAPGQAEGLFWAFESLDFPGLTIPVEGHSGGDPGLLTMMYRIGGTNRGFVLMVNGYRESDWTLLQGGRLIANLARAARLAR
ncbi:MAG: serine hydrolase domain-containing protein [Pseudomonadota bacterium]